MSVPPMSRRPFSPAQTPASAPSSPAHRPRSTASSLSLSSDPAAQISSSSKMPSFGAQHPLPHPSHSHSRTPSMPPAAPFDQGHLLATLGPEGQHALVAHEKTLDLYRANVKKTQDPSIQFVFAQYLISTAIALPNDPPRPPQRNRRNSLENQRIMKKSESTVSSNSNSSASSHSVPSLFATDDTHTPSSSSTTNGPARPTSPTPSTFSSNAKTTSSGGCVPANVHNRELLLREAATVLRKLADRGYADAQYLLGDALSSGLLTNGRPHLRESFGLFVSATKHGHSEAAYRAALCYEEGWGTASDVRKAVQFLRASAAKNHPGAMLKLGVACYYGQLGLTNHQKEGVKWLSRAAEVANEIFPQAPYELGAIYETGFLDIVIPDPSYAAQLYVRSAELGYTPAAARLGHAYELGVLGCPQDPALSVHYYTIAALAGDAGSMLALCAWYMVGAPPVLEVDTEEAFEWARKAADAGLPKAMYAVGHLYEKGVGTQRDLLEANLWYVRAAEGGDERAQARIKALNERPVNAVDSTLSVNSIGRKGKKEKVLSGSPNKLKRVESAVHADLEKDKDCIVM
ncbi:hypothetical protein V1508DRAFT_417437 [Lipomyces doorenjongii]|uniref:uncharacterized protein n=1 Tax=Lipomyces doorenjongii TaxID=383834 RepID=UPI0034CFD588